MPGFLFLGASGRDLMSRAHEIEETPWIAASRAARPLVWSRRVRAALFDRAARGYPHEVCGLLLGREAERGTAVERITQARNLAVERPADRYTLDPADFLAADRIARRDGLEIVGIWHTHPDHPARPSRTDHEAAWEGWSYVILSVGRGGVAARASFRLRGGRFEEQPIDEELVA